MSTTLQPHGRASTFFLSVFYIFFVGVINNPIAALGGFVRSVTWEEFSGLDLIEHPSTNLAQSANERISEEEIRGTHPTSDLDKAMMMDGWGFGNC